MIINIIEWWGKLNAAEGVKEMQQQPRRVPSEVLLLRSINIFEMSMTHLAVEQCKLSRLTSFHLMLQMSHNSINGRMDSITLPENDKSPVLNYLNTMPSTLFVRDD